MKKIAVLGSGEVGKVLAEGCIKHGYEVMRASREPAKLATWKESMGGKAAIGTPREAAKWADGVILAVKGLAAEAALDEAGIANLAGKVVIDTTNPIAEGKPDHGVLPYFTTHGDSLMERLQRKAPEARFVKAFSCVGNALMVNPSLAGGPPTMFLCGNDDAAKADVKLLLAKFGWETADMGPVQAARAIEPLCILWCIPGFRGDGWMHAFKLLKPA